MKLRHLALATALPLALLWACSGEDTASTKQAALVSSDLVISQVYGGGGNSNATFKNDFVEIFNRGGSSVQLQNYSIQYASAAGDFSTAVNFFFDLPSFTLAPGQYFLIQLASNANVGATLPTPDATGTIAVGQSDGKVVLVPSANKLSGCGSVGTPCASSAWVDLVAFGTGKQFEGSGAAPTLSSTKAAFRASGGCVDTGDNTADFTAALPAPRNSASALNVCATDAGSDATADADDGAIDAPSDVAVDVDDGGIILVDGAVDADLDAPVDAIADVSIDVDVDAGVDADVDAGLDADVDAGVDADVDAGVDADVDAGVDADVDAAIDAGVDADVDAAVDAGADAELDAGVDATADSGIDASFDAGVDAELDAGIDAAVDSGADAAVDASADAALDGAADATVDAAADAASDGATTDGATTDGATTDGATSDGATNVDGSTDDPGTIGGGGCTCNESGTSRGSAGSIALTLGVAVLLRRRKRRA